MGFEANIEKVKAGFKGGPFMKNLITPPKMTFVDVRPPDSTQRFGAGAIPQPMPIDTWFSRRK